MSGCSDLRACGRVGGHESKPYAASYTTRISLYIYARNANATVPRKHTQSSGGCRQPTSLSRKCASPPRSDYDDTFAKKQSRNFLPVVFPDLKQIQNSKSEFNRSILARTHRLTALQPYTCHTASPAPRGLWYLTALQSYGH